MDSILQVLIDLFHALTKTCVNWNWG